MFMLCVFIFNFHYALDKECEKNKVVELYLDYNGHARLCILLL